MLAELTKLDVRWNAGPDADGIKWNEEDGRNRSVIYSTNDILSIVTKAEGQLRRQENDIICILI